MEETMKKKTKIILTIITVILVFLTVLATLGNITDKPKKYPANPDYLTLQEKSGALRFCMFKNDEISQGMAGLAIRIDGGIRIFALQEAFKAKTGTEITAFNSIRELIPVIKEKQNLILDLIEEVKKGELSVKLYKEEDIELLIPFKRPPKLVDFGLYPMHDRNIKRVFYKNLAPSFMYHSTVQIHNFLTNDGFFYPTHYEDDLYHFYGNRIGIYGPNADNVKIPDGFMDIDIEAELAIVIARDGKNISEENAEDYIAGYCLYNDYSQRHIQMDELQHSRFGFIKSKTVNSLGPYFITDLELDKVTVVVKVNGNEVLTCGNDDLRWSLSKIISYASSLEEGIIEGEIIGFGTMSGGSFFELELPMLKAGDTVELIANQGLGKIKNKIVQ